MASKTRGIPSGDVANCEYCGIARTAEFVRNDAICDGKIGSLSQVGVWKSTNTNENRVGHDLTITGIDDACFLSFLNRFNNRFATKFDAVAGMKLSEDISDLCGYDARQWMAFLSQDDNLASGLACGRGDLKANQAGANDHDSFSVNKLPAEIEAVVQVSQIMKFGAARLCD